MKKLFALILIISMFSNLAFADDCDWTKIQKLPNGNYEYSLQLDVCVGKLVEDSKVKDQQIQDLNKVITLKDLALKDSDTRANLWSTTANNEQDRLSKINSDQKVNDIIWFSLGVLLTGLAVWGGAKALGR